MKKIKTGLVFGRFQVFHHDHLKYVLAAKEKCNYLLIGLANPDPSTTKYNSTNSHRHQKSANPLSYYERMTIINHTLISQGLPRNQFNFIPFPINFPKLIKYYIPDDITIFLTIYDNWGEERQKILKKQNYHTNVLWKKPQSAKGLNSSDIRQLIRNHQKWQHLVPKAAVEIMKKMKLIEKIQNTK